MPGIAGFHRWRNNCRAPEVEAALRRMAGPLCYSQATALATFIYEDGGAVAAAHGTGFEFQKRAAVEQAGVLLVMDGEVFPNAADVPPELHGRVPTIQRAEYCLWRYLERGIRFVEELNGTFAIAVWDRRDGSVHLATDRFGHRWMFYGSWEGNWAFASSVRSLLLLDEGIGRSYDRDALAELIVFERVLGGKTLFPDIRRLPAGCRATWSAHGWELTRYFTPQHGKTPGHLKCWKEAAQELVRLLRRSMEKRLADRPKAALFLSGGLDSRLVLGCTSSPLTAVTFSHPTGPPKEARVAATIAQAAGVPLVFLERGAEYYARIAQRAVEVNEGLATFVGCHSIGVHDQLKSHGFQVVFTGDRSDVAFKDYFQGLIDTDRLSPWSGSPVQTRRAARLLMGSPIIRRAFRQDVMILALNNSMKLQFAAVWEKTLQDIQQFFRPGTSMESTVAELALCDWQGLTAMGLIRGLCTEFIERSPFFDNDLWNLSLQIPTHWRSRGRIVRRAICLVSSRLARIPDVSTGVPPAIPWPWDGCYARCRQSLRNVAKSCARFSKTLSALRSPRPGTRIFTESGAHDRDAALRNCAEYRDLVSASIAQLPSDYFDLDMIQSLFHSDLASVAPVHGKLFEILITFALFHRRWGVGASRCPDSQFTGTGSEGI